ncbi:hypothetical protein Leryth_016116 [Lithospermum erythrorhizon]|nr:hypothetical protein Leryth_016116 [Lithospermum erythrorhizon]
MVFITKSVSFNFLSLESQTLHSHGNLHLAPNLLLSLHVNQTSFLLIKAYHFITSLNCSELENTRPGNNFGFLIFLPLK